MLVTTESFDTAMVVSATQAGAGVAGPLNGSKMILFTNQPALTKTTPLSALTQPTYASYAAQALTWSAPKRDGAGNISCDTGLVSWQQTGTPTPATIYGYGITNSGGTTLLAAEMFPAPVGLVDDLSFLGIVSEWSANNPQAGQATIVS